jgi:phytoene/squalene synthetase
VGGSDDPTEVRVPLEGIVDNLIEFSEATAGNIQALYTIAHELARYADQLRTTADRLEGVWPEEDDFFSDTDEDEPVDR